MNTAAVVLALLAPLLAVPVSAVSGRWGVLPMLVPRRWRWQFRSWRHGGTRSRQKSSAISKRLRARVLRADRYRCVYCGRRDSLQVDHVVPWIMGGLTVLWNCATLCKADNSLKSCYWVSPSGQAYYRGSRKPPAQAAQILAAERRARRNPWRWVRAYL